jgi:single-stranded DNA-binding protein
VDRREHHLPGPEAWGTAAENAAESLAKGDRVLVAGRIRTDVYTPDTGPNAGNEVRRLRVVTDEVAVSLRHATARPARAQRSSQVEPAEAS